MNKNYKIQLLRIKNIAGMFYSSGKKTEILIIYGIGAPILPDSGNLPDAPVIMKYSVDLFVPDYIGYGRSDGVFTPMNCIYTFLHLYDAFKKGCLATNSYDNYKIKLKYKRIIFIGRSLGGTYVPLLPRFNPKINELAIFCPVVDSKLCGSIKGEETNDDFLKSMKKDGYHHLYRGIMDPLWERHLENKDDLSPMDNIQYLKNTKLFIAHGKKDKCVNYAKSVKYFNKIISYLPQGKNQFKFKLYLKGSHGYSTTNPAVKDLFKWLDIQRISN